MQHDTSTRRVLRSRNCCRLLGVAALIAGVGLSAGCTPRQLELLSPGSRAELAGNEGFLIVQIDTDVATGQIMTNHAVVADALAPGRHLWLVRARAGRYRWASVGLTTSSGRGFNLELDEYAETVREDPRGRAREFRFRVYPGVVNYPGELVVRGSQIRMRSGAGFEIRQKNHSGAAIRALVDIHPKLVSTYGIRHTGPDRDLFIQRYLDERKQATRDLGASDTGGGGDEMQ